MIQAAQAKITNKIMNNYKSQMINFKINNYKLTKFKIFKL
jgi:hypothetical protein